MLIIRIHNDGTGDVKIGNYDYEVLINHDVIARGRVEGYHRGDGWQELVKLMVLDNELSLSGDPTDW